MDANDTRFHLVLTRAEWLGDAPADTPSLTWSDGSLRLASVPRTATGRAGESPPTVSDRRGAGGDRYGNWYWVSDNRREIRVLWNGAGAGETFWRPGATTPGGTWGC